MLVVCSNRSPLCSFVIVNSLLTRFCPYSTLVLFNLCLSRSLQSRLRYPFNPSIFVLSILSTFVYTFPRLLLYPWLTLYNCPPYIMSFGSLPVNFHLIQDLKRMVTYSCPEHATYICQHVDLQHNYVDMLI